MTSMQEGLSVSVAELESLVVADDLALHEKGELVNFLLSHEKFIV